MADGVKSPCCKCIVSPAVSTCMCIQTCFLSFAPCFQFKFSDGVSGDLTTAHPSVLSDGTYVNFTRSVPMGGFHLYKQDPVTLKRTEVRRGARVEGGVLHRGTPELQELNFCLSAGLYFVTERMRMSLSHAFVCSTCRRKLLMSSSRRRSGHVALHIAAPSPFNSCLSACSFRSPSSVIVIRSHQLGCMTLPLLTSMPSCLSTRCT